MLIAACTCTYFLIAGVAVRVMIDISMREKREIFGDATTATGW